MARGEQLKGMILLLEVRQRESNEMRNISPEQARCQDGNDVVAEHKPTLISSSSRSYLCGALHGKVKVIMMSVVSSISSPLFTCSTVTSVLIK